MGTGWVSVSPSPLSENTPPPVGRVPGRLTVPTGQAVATVGTTTTHHNTATTCHNTATDALPIYIHLTSSTRTTPRTAKAYHGASRHQIRGYTSKRHDRPRTHYLYIRVTTTDHDHKRVNRIE